MTSVLNAQSVSLARRLKRTDLQVKPGELVAVIGPNGGGKTSLLRAVAGIERTSGSVTIAGEELDSIGPSRRPYRLTFLAASRELVWPISTRDAIGLGLPKSDEKRVDDILDLLELTSLADRPVDRLSTGERARVLFGRAIAPEPQLLLLDEPLSNLDPYWVLRFLEIMRELTTNGAAAMVALHDIDRVTEFDRAILVSAGEILADLLPQVILGSQALTEAFRIERESSGWKVRR